MTPATRNPLTPNPSPPEAEGEGSEASHAMTVAPAEYLVNYGVEAFLGRFTAPANGDRLGRGDRVVVRGHRGVEVGTVLCNATPGHAHFLTGRTEGPLLRRASWDDEAIAAGTEPFEAARSLSREFRLPIELVDIEVLLDPRTVVLYHLRTGEGNLRPLVKELARRFTALVEMQDVRLGIATEYGDENHERKCGPDRAKTGGCGSGGCGSGGCGNGACGTGGCGNGQCGTAALVTLPDGAAAYLLQLRSKLERLPH